MISSPNEKNKMVKAVIVLVIAIIFLVVALSIKMSYKNDLAQAENYKQTYATMERTIFSDTGSVMYYVTFTDNGKVYTAQTDHYTSKTKSLNLGDTVKIGYFFICGNKPHAIIFDDRVIPVSDSVPSAYKFFTVV